MEASVLQNLFIALLRSELTETELEEDVKAQLTPDAVSELFTLSKKHDLAHVLSAPLIKHGLIEDASLLSKFKREEHLAIFRCEQMRYAYSQICGALDEAALQYVPLKGSVIRSFYPREYMRTSCDIDILVREEDLESAISALIGKGFTLGDRNYHDVSLFSQNKIHLELHFNLKENNPSLDSVLKDAWQYALQSEGARYEFSEAFFLYHMFAHMSYHFLAGGCGVRPLMDIWVIMHKMGIDISCAEGLLRQAGIYKFAQEISELCEICFSGMDKTDFTDALLSYIISGGVYGSFDNIIAVERSKNQGTVIYAIKRLFLPYSSMEYLYPVLKKCPILLPLCYVKRFFGMIFRGKTKSALKEIKALNSVTDSEAVIMQNMRDRLGLK